jgi:hypothetical protein
MAADLVRREVSLIVVDTPAALAVKAATTTVPIIFVTRATRLGMASSPTSMAGRQHHRC